MKVLHINSYYSVGKFYKNLYEMQIKSGLDISVFIPVTKNFNKSEFDYGKYTTISPNHNEYDRYIFHLKHYKILLDITGKYSNKEYLLNHAHTLFSNGYIAMKLKEKFGVPYIVAVRNTDVNLFFKKMIYLRKLGIKILQDADKVVFLSKPYRDFVVDKYIPRSLQERVLDKSVVIPNGIDEFWFDNIGIRKQKLKTLNLRLLQVGDIDKNKNIETTVSVAELLIKKGYKVKLDVVGKVKDQKIFDKIKDKDFLNYLGYKTKEELIKIYKNNDIFILPSIHETFGLVYAEAMSQGLPVIYTRGQGFDGQFGEGIVGYSVDANNVNEIVEKVINITEKYEAISKRCLDQSKIFRWEMIANQYYELYQSICHDSQ